MIDFEVLLIDFEMVVLISKDLLGIDVVIDMYRV